MLIHYAYGVSTKDVLRFDSTVVIRCTYKHIIPQSSQPIFLFGSIECMNMLLG